MSSTGPGGRLPGTTREQDQEMRRYHAARWDEPTVMELGRPGRRGVLIPAAGPAVAAAAADPMVLIPTRARRALPPACPS